MAEVLVVGSLAYDSIETPAGKVARTLGGSANYFSLACSLFSPTRVVGVVGEDYSAEDRKLLTDRKVDLAGLKTEKGQTFHWEGTYLDNLNEAKTLKTDLNVFADFDPIIPSHFQNSQFVFLANIAPPLQMKVLEQVKSPLFVGMDTMNFWISSQLAALKATISKVNICLINEGEARDLTQTSNAIAAASELCKMGPEAVVIKRGEYGFVLFHRDHGFFILPAVPIAKVVDPTGAGDSFAGAFFGTLAALKRKPNWVDLQQACINGTVVASYTIESFGVSALQEVNLDLFSTRKGHYLSVVTHSKS